MGGKSILQSLASCPNMTRDALALGCASNTTRGKLIVLTHICSIFRHMLFETTFSLLLFAPSLLPACGEFPLQNVIS